MVLREPEVVPIEGGITNRNVRVDVEGSSYVVRLPGEDTALLGIAPRACSSGNDGGWRS